MSDLATNTIYGDEVARVAGVASVCRIWISYGADSNGCYTVTCMSGPGAMRTDDTALEGAVIFATDDTTSKA